MTPPSSHLHHRVALGGASFSLPDDRDDDAAAATIQAAVDAGIGIIDSARAYAPVGDPTHNEQLFARALRGRDDVLLGTKGGHFRVGPADFRVDNSPERLRRDVHESLHAFGVSRLGLYYLHRADDQVVPTLESMEALDALRRDGLIAAVGISNATTAQLDELDGRVELAAVQNRHDLRHPDRDVVAWCERHRVAFFAYSPLGSGAGARELATTLPALASRAADRGISVQRLALAALLASSPVVSVVSGASRRDSAVDSAAAETEAWGADDAAALASDLG